MSSEGGRQLGVDRAAPRSTWWMLVVLALLLLGCSLGRNDENPTPSVANAGVFDRVWTAKGVDSNGAPVEPTRTFNGETTDVYVVAEIGQLPAGAVMARWQKEGEPYEDSPPVSVDVVTTSGYLYFYLQPDGGAAVLEPGLYAVTLVVNDQSVASTEFQIIP